MSTTWDARQEIKQLVWADVIIFQFPVHWFSVPWQLKQYIDEVYPVTKNAGSNGKSTHHLLKGRKYLLSTLWHTPRRNLINNERLYEQAGIDGIFLWLHKANEQCGMQGLPSFSCHQTHTKPDAEVHLEHWDKYLELYFKAVK